MHVSPQNLRNLKVSTNDYSDEPRRSKISRDETPYIKQNPKEEENVESETSP